MLKTVFRTILFLLAAGTLSVPLTGCNGGGGGGGTGPGADFGEVVIGLTDAQGDFLTYEVDVTSITLVRDDGLTVEAVPRATRVDFAQYTELTELFTVATVPRGTYTEISLGLDYTNANVQVEVDGAPVPAAIFDEDGVPLRAKTVVMELDNRHFLNVKHHAPSHLILDFDLAASHEVDLSDPAAPVVVLRPYLLAKVNPDVAHKHRLRGVLTGVNPDAQLFHVRVLPFFHRDGGFGTFPVKTGADTHFEIDGVAYIGDEGLKALAALPEHAPVVAFGQVNRAHRHMRASHVRAGSSVPWFGRQAVSGTVSARDGDLLTVLDAVITFGDGRRGRVPLASVMVGPDTRVIRDATDDRLLDKDDISIGQRITAVGHLVPTVALDGATPLDPPADPEALAAEPTWVAVPPLLDVTDGFVRLNISGLSGRVLETGPELLIVALATMNGHPQEVLDFTGTGFPGEGDADPAHYEIDVQGLTLDTVSVGDLVHVRGYVYRFGSAPPDFIAESVIVPALGAIADAALLKVRWEPPTGEPFTGAGPDGAVLNLAGSPLAHHVVLADGVIDLTTLSRPVRLVPEVNDEVLVALISGDAIRQFHSFGAFVEALNKLLAEGYGAGDLFSLGTWQGDAATFHGQTTGVRVHKPFR